jgi:glucokinase
MHRSPTITAQGMRSINRSAILEMIRRESPISRNMIAEKLQVSLPTVMRIVDDLVKEDLIRPQSSKQWTGGRRRSLLEFNADAQVVIGIDLGGTNMFGAVADLGGRILDEVDVNRHGSSGEQSFQLLVELTSKLLASRKIEGRRIRGIGVGAPGITHHKEGVVKWAYALNWRDYPLKAKLTESFHLPVTVDNDVNLAALGEWWFGAGQNTQNMILIAIGTGIGAGIITEGALYRGASEASGEIGHMIPGKEFLGKRYIEFGALEYLASETGIAERARQTLKDQRDAAVLKNLLAEDVFDAARQGQAWAQSLVAETVDYLAIAVANLSVSFDPEVIVLGGGITHSADLLVQPILRRLDGVIPTLPRLEISPLGRRAAVMGAIINVLHNTDDFYLLRKLS